MNFDVVYNGYAEYLGKTMCGFTNSNKYHIEISKDLYGYTVYGITNLSEKGACTGVLQYASEISLQQRWSLDGKLNNETD